MRGGNGWSESRVGLPTLVLFYVPHAGRHIGHIGGQPSQSTTTAAPASPFLQLSPTLILFYASNAGCHIGQACLRNPPQQKPHRRRLGVDRMEGATGHQKGKGQHQVAAAAAKLHDADGGSWTSLVLPGIKKYSSWACQCPTRRCRCDRWLAVKWCRKAHWIPFCFQDSTAILIS